MKQNLRRLAAVLGAAVIGVTATFALASPASAHTSKMTVSSNCDTVSGKYVLTYTFSNDWPTEGAVSKVASVPDKDSVLDLPATIAARVGKVNGTAVATQTVAGNTKLAGLSLLVKWKDGAKSLPTAGTKLAGDCVVVAAPTANATSACNGTVTVHLAVDANAWTDVTFLTRGGKAFALSSTLHKGEKKDVVVPATDSSAVTVTVGEKQLYQGAWTAPKDCKPAVASGVSDCKNLTVTIANPADGLPGITATVEYDGKTQDVKVAAGKSENVVLVGKAGLAAKVTINEQVSSVAFAPQASCTPSPAASAAPSVSPTVSGALPVTGTSIGIFAGIAALAVAGGGALFVMARRRRTSFSA